MSRKPLDHVKVGLAANVMVVGLAEVLAATVGPLMFPPL
jgi:hypothetical protein